MPHAQHHRTTARAVPAAGGGDPASAVPHGSTRPSWSTRSSTASGSACMTGTCSPSPSTPTARSFVGLDNYVRTLWGRNIELGSALPARSCKPQVSSGSGWPFFGHFRGTMSRPTALARRDRGGRSSSCCPAFHPGEGGRWYDRRFWPTVGQHDHLRRAGRAGRHDHRVVAGRGAGRTDARHRRCCARSSFSARCCRSRSSR